MYLSVWKFSEHWPVLKLLERWPTSIFGYPGTRQVKVPPFTLYQQSTFSDEFRSRFINTPSRWLIRTRR